MEHVSAKEVFPKAFLRRIQKYWTGYVYIPKKRDWHLARRRRIVQHRRRGVKAETITKWFGISARRVQQIVREEREK